MPNSQISKKNINSEAKRIDNRFLYFLAFKLPLTSSYSNRTFVNHFDILIARDYPRQHSYVLSSNFLGDISVLHNLVINNIFKLYL